jgi:endonuclease YncB( thermonuclease family)
MKTTRLISKFLIIFLLFCTTAFALKEETLHGKVMQVKDGDTVVISPIDGGQFFICRLHGIDTPKITHGRTLGQPWTNHGQNKWLEKPTTY